MGIQFINRTLHNHKYVSKLFEFCDVHYIKMWMSFCRAEHVFRWATIFMFFFSLRIWHHKSCDWNRDEWFFVKLVRSDYGRCWLNFVELYKTQLHSDSFRLFLFGLSNFQLGCDLQFGGMDFLFNPSYIGLLLLLPSQFKSFNILFAIN